MAGVLSTLIPIHRLKKEKKCVVALHARRVRKTTLMIAVVVAIVAHHPVFLLQQAEAHVALRTDGNGKRCLTTKP